MKIALILLVAGMTLTLYSCRKPVQEGKIVTASGIVYDSVKNKPLPNAKLYLFGAHQTFYGIYYVEGPLDSVTADHNGRFSLRYTAEGQSIDYGLSLGELG